MNNKVKLFEDYLREIQEREFSANRGFSYPKNQEKEAKLYMLDDLALKQAELEEKIDFIMENAGPLCKAEYPTLGELYKSNLKNKKKGVK